MGWQKGKPNPAISASNRNRWRDPEYRARMSELSRVSCFAGRTHTVATLEKMHRAWLQRKASGWQHPWLWPTSLFDVAR